MPCRLLDLAPFLSLLLSIPALGCSGSADVVPSGPSQANPLDADEQSLLDLVNDLRVSNAAAPLTGCVTLNVSASTHADDMRDRGYLKDVTPEGATPRQRACEAGYASACSETTAMAELVASGNYAPDLTLAQWTKDAATQTLLVDPGLVVIGIGFSVGGDSPVWAADFGGAVEASCTGQ